MKSYLLPGLDGAQRQRLVNAGVTFYEWAGDTLIEEPQLKQALETLGVASATEQATDFENMFRVSLRFRGPEDERPRVVGLGLDPNSPRGRAREQYIKICSARIQAIVQDTLNLAVAQQKALPAVLNQFATNSRAVAFASGAGSEAARRAEFAQELTRVLEVPQVKDVRVIPGCLCVYTQRLCATNRDTGAKHEIGEFLIRIRLDGLEGGVRWFNATRRVNGVRDSMNAPNVYADGSPCADEMLQTFIELIAQCQFAVVAELAIQFIETVGNDELSRTLDRWPVAKSA